MLFRSMLAAGGDYDASLLVLDSIWSNCQMEVQGDVVVAVPTRDLLLVTGSRDPQGILKVKEIVHKASNGSAYRLTQKLFVYRNGKFHEFRDGAEPDDATSPSQPAGTEKNQPPAAAGSGR